MRQFYWASASWKVKPRDPEGHKGVNVNCAFMLSGKRHLYGPEKINTLESQDTKPPLCFSLNFYQFRVGQ